MPAVASPLKLPPRSCDAIQTRLCIAPDEGVASAGFVAPGWPSMVSSVALVQEPMPGGFWYWRLTCDALLSLSQSFTFTGA